MTALSDEQTNDLDRMSSDEIFEEIVRIVAETEDQPTFGHVEEVLDQLVDKRVLTYQERDSLLSHNLDTDGQVAPVHTASNSIEAGFVASALRSEGFPAFVEDKRVGDPFGGMMPFARIRVCVAESDVEGARQVIDELDLDRVLEPTTEDVSWWRWLFWPWG